MKKYIVIIEPSITAFEESVNNAIEKGYLPSGSMAISPQIGYEKGAYVQPMVYRVMEEVKLAITELDKMVPGDDQESAHGTAEDILCGVLYDCGLGDVADAFERAKERVCFWYV